MSAAKKMLLLVFIWFFIGVVVSKRHFTRQMKKSITEFNQNNNCVKIHIIDGKVEDVVIWDDYNSEYIVFKRDGATLNRKTGIPLPRK